MSAFILSYFYKQGFIVLSFLLLLVNDKNWKIKMYLKSLDSVENYTSRQWETTKFFSIRLFFFFFYSTIIQYYELRNCMFGMGENSPKMKINNLKGKKKKKKRFSSSWKDVLFCFGFFINMVKFHNPYCLDSMFCRFSEIAVVYQHHFLSVQPSFTKCTWLSTGWHGH